MKSSKDNLLFIEVVEDLCLYAPERYSKKKGTKRYARFHLKTTLQLMGCKPNHAAEISENIFRWLSEVIQEDLEEQQQQQERHDHHTKHTTSNSNGVHEEKQRYLENGQETENETQLLERYVKERESESLKPHFSNEWSLARRKKLQPDVRVFASMRKRAGSDSEQPTPKNLSDEEDLSAVERGMARISVESDDTHHAFRSQDKKKRKFRPGSPKRFYRSASLDTASNSTQYVQGIKSILRNYDWTARHRNVARSSSKTRKDIVCLSRSEFVEIVRVALASYHYLKPDRGSDFRLACEIGDRRRPLVILFCGASGTGKSTLSSLLATRLGISTVLSTDCVRHTLRNFFNKEDCPELFASTYHAGEALSEEQKAQFDNEAQICLEGYKRQCRIVLEHLDKIIASSERRNEPMVIEGVHLLPEYVIELMQRHPSCIPYTVYISNRQKHRERFAIRAKYMTLDARTNKYIKYFANIRTIQDYLVGFSRKYRFPTVDNTNVDRSLASVHYSIFNCVRHLMAGGTLFDKQRNCTVIPPLRIPPLPWSSKAMLRMLRSSKAGQEEVRRQLNVQRFLEMRHMQALERVNGGSVENSPSFPAVEEQNAIDKMFNTDPNTHDQNTWDHKKNITNENLKEEEIEIVKEKEEQKDQEENQIDEKGNEGDDEHDSSCPSPTISEEGSVPVPRKRKTSMKSADSLTEIETDTADIETVSSESESCTALGV